jgi:hypothetical protein
VKTKATQAHEAREREPDNMCRGTLRLCCPAMLRCLLGLDCFTGSAVMSGVCGRSLLLLTVTFHISICLSLGSVLSGTRLPNLNSEQYAGEARY